MRFMPDVQVPILPMQAGAPVIILSDASGKKASVTRRPRGHLGFVLWHPEAGAVHSDARVPEWLTRLFDELQRRFGHLPRSQYITPYEAVAMLTPYLTCPQLLYRRYVLHFVDNSGALYASLKCYSGVPEMARIVHFWRLTVLSLQAVPWLDYVPSESNLGDEPSRAEEGGGDHNAPLWAIGRFVPMVLPRLTDLSGEWMNLERMASMFPNMFRARW